jgi:predicted metal-dependent hydrolase
MGDIQYGNRKISFRIERSNRRKTLGIYVTPKAEVVIRSPQSLRVDEIKELVRGRARWIIEKQESIKAHGRFIPEKEFVSGETFPYLGREYRLKVIRSTSEAEEGCKLISGRFFVGINGDLDSRGIKKTVKETLMDWYVKRAKEKIPERVELYARQIGEWPKKVEIKDNKRRWGSCSRNGIVRFNWKIILASVTMLDYVIVHELCHLIHDHHSAEFWQKVQTIIPDCARRRTKLKDHSHLVEVFD